MSESGDVERLEMERLDTQRTGMWKKIRWRGYARDGKSTDVETDGQERVVGM